MVRFLKKLLDNIFNVTLITVTVNTNAIVRHPFKY